MCWANRRAGCGNWQLALEQTTNLQVAYGSPAAVAAAVRRGADLRLYMTTATYEETLYFQQTYAGEADAFAGLMTHHHSYMHRGAIPKQPYFSFFKYDTSGTFLQVKWMLDNRVFDESQAHPYGVYRWFVCDRWRLVYEHDSHGNRVSGDLEDSKTTPAKDAPSKSASASFSVWPTTTPAARHTSRLSIRCNR